MKFSRQAILAIVAGLGSVFGVGERQAAADTITVCEIGCDYATIQAAFNAAGDGDTVEIGPGIFTISNNLICPEGVTVIGAPDLNKDGLPDTEIVRAPGTFYSVYFNPGAFEARSLTFRDCVVENGSSDLRMVGCAWVGLDSRLFHNVNSGSGGTYEGCAFWGNSYSIQVNGSGAEFIDCEVSGSDVPLFAVRIYGASNECRFVRCRFRDLHSSNSSYAPIYVDNSPSLSAYFVDCDFESCSGEGRGGAIRSKGLLYLSGCSATGNAAAVGGFASIEVSGLAFVTGCEFRGNTATFGGAIYAESSGALAISSTTVCGNSLPHFYEWMDLGDVTICDACDDCNGNGQLDSCEIEDGLAEDCNGNGIIDSCELGAGDADCNGNGLLDACEVDCDGDGLPDDCTIAAGADDCNLDGIPDACQAGEGLDTDANNDGIPDACQVMAFRGLETEIVAIEDRVFDTTVPATAVCYRIYATVDSPKSSVLGIYGDLDASMSIQSGSGFWQFPLGGDLSSSVPCDESGQFPDLRYDSWLTIGATCASNDMTLGIGIDYTAFNSGGGIATDNGIVFVDPDQIQSRPDGEGRVLIAQLTTVDGTLPTGYLNAFGMNPDGSEWIATGVTWPEPELVDCNGNGVHDAYDLASGASRDCDGSGLPDECEFAELLDCNNNGVLDICDIADGSSADTDGDWIPDECFCYGDATRDGLVNVDDIIEVVLSWGQIGESYADINGDLVVDGQDLSLVLAGFGSCG